MLCLPVFKDPKIRETKKGSLPLADWSPPHENPSIRVSDWTQDPSKKKQRIHTMLLSYYSYHFFSLTFDFSCYFIFVCRLVLDWVRQVWYLGLFRPRFPNTTTWNCSFPIKAKSGGSWVCRTFRSLLISKVRFWNACATSDAWLCGSPSVRGIILWILGLN